MEDVIVTPVNRDRIHTSTTDGVLRVHKGRNVWILCVEAGVSVPGCGAGVV